MRVPLATGFKFINLSEVGSAHPQTEACRLLLIAVLYLSQNNDYIILFDRICIAGIVVK